MSERQPFDKTVGRIRLVIERNGSSFNSQNVVLTRQDGERPFRMTREELFDLEYLISRTKGVANDA